MRVARVRSRGRIDKSVPVFFFSISLYFFFSFPGRHLLSSLSQLVTLPFQSQVCLSKSKAKPPGHVICFSPDLVHLRGKQLLYTTNMQNSLVIFVSQLKKIMWCVYISIYIERASDRHVSCGRKILWRFFFVTHGWSLLSSCSQFLTLVFQSQVWRSMSKAKPVGHLTVASLVTPISVAWSHLNAYRLYSLSEYSPFHCYTDFRYTSMCISITDFLTDFRYTSI